ncbi:MAG: DUF354 domain-containing protein [Bacteroidota bacterium]
MKILIDINHPAHVHYFKNFIKIMESKGHTFVITNRNSKIINQLLDKYQISHITRNIRPTKKSFFYTAKYLIGIIYACIKASLKEKPEMYVGFGSFPCTFTAFLFRKPVILLDDTEHNNASHSLNKPFQPIVLTPFYYKKELGTTQIYFNAYVEQLYLHSHYYQTKSTVLEELNLIETEYALVRFIAYDARHDSKVKPISEEFKKQIVLEISKKMKVIVSLESDNADEFYKPYQVFISPEKMHDIIANASFFVTEGATMASEAGILGVPYIYINPLQEVGNVIAQVNSYPEIASQTIDESNVMILLREKLDNSISTETKNKIRNQIESSTINPTQLLVWFVENYPESVQTLKDNSDYQYNFK